MMYKEKNPKINKSGSVIIYVVFLLVISLILATIIFDSTILLKNEKSINEIERKIDIEINEKFISAANISNYYNSNGSGFIDIVSCPKNFSMSGTSNAGVISTFSTFSNGEISCLGTYLSDTIELFFNEELDDLSGAIYKGSTITLGLASRTGVFLDGDSTLIDLSNVSFVGPDGIDDNMNSDNNLGTSIGVTSYANGFEDDDSMARKILGGYVKKGVNKNIFWSNTKVLDYINLNSNNYDLLNVRLGLVNTGVLYLNVSKNSILKILEIDRTIYEDFGTIKINDFFTGSIFSNSGYLQNNSGVLSLTGTKTGNEYLFDFKNKDYALFLENTSIGVLNYSIKGESVSGTGIYIVPLNDSSISELSFLGHNIIKYEGKYISKIQELKKYLTFGVGTVENNILVIDGPGRRWSNGNIAKTCKEYKFPPSGYVYQGAGGSGYYYIKPFVSSFLVYCDMNPVDGGWTVAKINNGTRFQSIGINLTTYLKAFTYDLDQNKILEIKALSTNFKQYFKKECYRSIVFNGNGGGAVKWDTYGLLNIFGNNFPSYGICDSHNNDTAVLPLPTPFPESAGYVFSGTLLPITRIYGGDTASMSGAFYIEDSYYEFGDFYMR